MLSVASYNELKLLISFGFAIAYKQKQYIFFRIVLLKYKNLLQEIFHNSVFRHMSALERSKNKNKFSYSFKMI